ncbi:O-antigen ligase family protein [Buttiauxella sp. 3AFRM03]|uniref:O-antigen ligase family protein n=1 Tax=Buttiauxella sp. 3AFRM03 TaxID=2479367 RepID=UPI000EF7FBC7|nr:O-antigen ligase family protein [Buttiauxella sp. 3AFRM03]AYN28196.1 O-antigen ligase family protein [Buttiauxella sp. 3AFRM03]
MEKLRSRLYITVFVFAVLSLAFALLSNARQRDFYYIAVYLGVIGLVIERKNITFRKFNIAYPIILLGVVKLIWFLWLGRDATGYNTYSDQLGAGKKLLLGGILVFYITQCSYYIRAIKCKNVMLAIIGFAFLSATCYAFWQFYHGMGRVEMAVNRATISAYIYSTLSMVCIYFLYLQKKPVCYVIAALAILLSFVVIILTGTRAAIILHLLIIALMTVYYFKKIHIKSTLVVLIIAMLAVLSLYKNYIHPKIEQTYNEVTLYQEGRDNTSLGSRFSMWTVGIKNFGNAPFGQTMQSRLNYSDEFTSENPQYRTTMEFINVHLHDEMIETLSLQGIFGGLSLLWFYVSICWIALRERNTPLLFTMNGLITYGLSDVLLLSSEAILFYIALIAVCSVKTPPKQIAE